MKQRIILSMLVLIAALASCDNKSDLEHGKDQTGQVAAEFTTQIQTRAAGNSWSANDQIGVFMINEGKTLSISSIVNGADNIAYKTAESGISANFSVVTASQKIYFPGSGNVDFISYYPFKPAVDGHIYSVDIADQSNQEAIDLLYSNNAKGKNSSNASVAFSFKHKLTKLSVKISGDAYTEKELAAAIVKIKGMNTSASFSLSLDSFLLKSKVADMTLKAVAAGKTYEAIVIPTSSLSGATLEFTIAGKTLSWDITTAAFVKGNRYNFNLVLGRNDVTIGDSTIEDWEDNPAPGVEVKKIQYANVENMSIQYRYNLNGKADLIKMWEINSAGATVSGGFSEQITISYAGSVATMEGTVPNPNALSYLGKEHTPLRFAAKYMLNEEGLASSCVVTIRDSLKRTIEKYTMNYEYNADNQLVYFVMRDTTGERTSETKATWENGNMTSCVMGYFIDQDVQLPDTIRPDTTKPASKSATTEWITTIETYTYDSRMASEGALLPLILPTPYYSEDVIGMFASSIGLLGKGPKNYLAKTVESGDSRDITYVFPSGSQYPSSATISYSSSLGTENVKFTFK